MADPFDALLIHTCTITTNVADHDHLDERGNPTVTPTETTGVTCRFTRPRQWETIMENGIAVAADGKLFMKLDSAVAMRDTVKDIKDEDGDAVITGEFEVVQVLPVAGRTGHHTEVLVRRA